MPCDFPYYVGDIPVPCGRCPPCKKRRVDSWVFRLLQEDKVSSSAHFVTLTYDTRFVPISPNGFMTLRKKDFQDYMKRLRKICPGSTLKYYAVGEYGSKNRRPHYHAIIFNVPRETLFADAWVLNGSSLGEIFVGGVSGDSIAYTMKYIDKSTWKCGHSRDDRESEFPLMSKGLGANYLTPSIVTYHKADLSRLYVTRPGGYKSALPRYYRDKIFTASEKSLQRSLAQEATHSEFSSSRREFELLGYGLKIDYGEWLASKKRGRIESFYSKQKNRKL